MTFHKKPIRKAKENCSPISSNCIIWQGPDIPFLDLCDGDSITEVVFELAQKVETLLTTLDPESYDLECLEFTCPPTTFEEVFQALVNKVCKGSCDCNTLYYKQYEQYQQILTAPAGENPAGTPFFLTSETTVHVTPLDLLIEQTGEYIIKVDFSILGPELNDYNLGYELRIEGVPIPFSTRVYRFLSGVAHLTNVGRTVMVSANILKGQTVELWVFNDSAYPSPAPGLNFIAGSICATKTK